MEDLLIKNQYGVEIEISSFEGEEIGLIIYSDMTAKSIYLEKEKAAQLRDWLNKFLAE